MSRRRTSNRRRRRKSRAAMFPSSDGGDDTQVGRRWLFKAVLVTGLLFVAMKAVVPMTPPSHTGTDEAAADVMHSAHSGETTLLLLKPTCAENGTKDAHIHHINNTTAVPADLACLQHGFDDLDAKAVHNPFKNVCIQRRSIFKSTAPSFEALKRYWVEKLSLNDKVRNSTHLPTSLSDLADLDGFDDLDITRLKDRSKNAMPHHAARILNKADPSTFGSWKKRLNEHRLTDYLTTFLPAFKDDDDDDDSDLMLVGNHFQQAGQQVRHINNTTAVPADLACLQHGFDDLDVKAVHNPFKNVCIQRRSIFKSTPPSFEALKMYWVEKLSLNDKVRNSTHLPTSLTDLDGFDNADFIGPHSNDFSDVKSGDFNGLDLTTGYKFSYENFKFHSRLARRLQGMGTADVEGRKTYEIDQFLEEFHPPKIVLNSEYIDVGGFKNSTITPVNKTLSATDTISASELIKPSSSLDMIDNDCLDNKDAVLLKNSTDPNLSVDSVNVTKNHDESCRSHELLMRSKTAVAVVVGTLAVTSAIYDYMA
ncbi:Hypp9234 [Branchiostoma lanceolatum]|uniref:Hypp9234 protein n=1 Tax=Branchiostoma lanceolatum TaxID=7740 RepID=A0A8J9ZCT7_BRALA|nr:Hypp9234 [Branchiostoma lanceolatum]